MDGGDEKTDGWMKTAADGVTCDTDTQAARTVLVSVPVWAETGEDSSRHRVAHKQAGRETDVARMERWM